MRYSRYSVVALFLSVFYIGDEVIADGQVRHLTIAEVRKTMKGSKEFAGKSLKGLNLSKMDLSGANLSGADLSDAVLSYANFTRANLSHANLDHANIVGAIFANADLENASLNDPIVAVRMTAKPIDVPDFKDADLVGARILILKNDSQLGADFTDAKLQKANISGANLTNVVLKGADLSAANLTGASLCGAMLTDANFRQAKLKDADFDCATDLEHAKGLSAAYNYKKP